MAAPFKSTANRDPPARENPPSNNLWIGNVSPEVSDAELKALFEKHGKVDSVTSYPPRNYAFVYFKDVDGARSAKQALQNHIFHGNSLKIQFAKPAKPCKSLWVAGISQSVSKEELEKEFLRFGKIQEFRFIRERNTAFVDYIRLEDATQALKSMNGKRIGGAPIRVDYLRSQASKREQGPDMRGGQFSGRYMPPSDFHGMGQDSWNHYPEHSLSGSKRPNQLSIGSDAPPSNVLWIKHPPSVNVEEDMLHNAMILFGEIERIKTFSDRNHAFVEFRSIEEARRAKEGLQGKLFNDPRISIEYSSIEFPGVRGQAGEFPLQPMQMDIHGLNRPVSLNNNPGYLPSHGIRGADLYMRQPFGHQRNFEPALPGSEFIDLADVHKLQNRRPQTLMGGPAWRRSSPTPGGVSSPSAGFNVPNRSVSGAWDVFDANQLQRESKRSKIDAALPFERSENQDGFDEPYGPHSLSGPSGSLARARYGGLGQRHDESDCIWRGLITKGRTPVCRARCVPLGEGLDTAIPNVVDCSARTGLDLLSKHYDDAIGFNIVFFLPDSEEDFASYTEFLRYLGSRDRAGVAKFDDGTTLFLVPPSEFLTKVLKISGPERLYGVVLKFAQAPPASTPMNPLSIHPHYADPHKRPTLQTGYNAIPPYERVLPPLDNSRVLPDDSKFPSKTPAPVASSFPPQSAPPATVAPQASLALTPELIATLTSLLPSTNASPASQSAPISQMQSMPGSTSNVAANPDSFVAHWKHGHQAVDNNGQHVQQLSNQINSPLQHQPFAQSAPIISNTTSNFHQPLSSYSQMHDQTISFPLQGAGSSRPVTSAIPLQSGSFSVTPQFNQQYQQVSSQDVLRGQGIDNGTDAQRFYNSPNVQQHTYHVASSNQVYVNDVSLVQPYMPLPSEAGFTNQSQPLQTAPYGVVQENTEAEADKNERYKSTLLFAANLLSRIHQPSGNQPGQGAGSH